MSADPGTVVQRYYDWFNQRNFDAAAELVAPDATLTHHATRQRLIGRAGYRAFAEAWVKAFPDANVSVTWLTTEGDSRVIAELIGRGTHDGVLDLGDLSLPPTGRQAELTLRQYFEIRDGRIVDAVLEFDVEEMRRVLMD